MQLIDLAVKGCTKPEACRKGFLSVKQNWIAVSENFGLRRQRQTIAYVDRSKCSTSRGTSRLRCSSPTWWCDNRAWRTARLTHLASLPACVYRFMQQRHFSPSISDHKFGLFFIYQNIAKCDAKNVITTTHENHFVTSLFSR